MQLFKIKPDVHRLIVLPVQQLPVLSTPAVFEFFCVHPSDFIKIGLVDSKQAKAIYLPVTLETRKTMK